MVARSGDQAPGLPTGVTYADFHLSIASRPPMLNDAGGVMFYAALAGGGVTTANNSAIFAGDPDAPRPVFRTGDAAPGTSPGVTFAGFGTTFVIGDPFLAPAFNDAGQVAALLRLTGPGVVAARDDALYLFDPTAGPILIAREGQLFDAGDGLPARVIADSGVRFVGGKDDNLVIGLNDAGTLAFALQFTDNTSGIFTATVPEPSTGAVLAVAATVTMLRRRRSNTK